MSTGNYTKVHGDYLWSMPKIAGSNPARWPNKEIEMNKKEEESNREEENQKKEDKRKLFQFTPEQHNEIMSTFMEAFTGRRVER